MASTENKHDFDAFISYSWADQDWVRDLAEQLESETIDGLPTSRHLRIFTDELEIEPGENIPRKLSEGLQQCRFFLPVLSPEFLNSEFSAFEWTHVVAEDPANRLGKMIPLLRRDISNNGEERINLTAPFKSLKYLDFRRKEDFKKKYTELLRRVRGLPITRSRRNRRPIGMQVQNAGIDPIIDTQAEYPDRCTEVLLSNLVPIQQLPETIYSYPVKSRKPKEFYQATGFEWPVLLKSGKAYCFANISEHTEALKEEIGDHEQAAESLVDWFNSEDKRRDLVQLLNRCLESYMVKMGIRKEFKNRRFFFRLNQDGSDREIKIGDDAPRTVAAVKESKDGTGRFFVHHAARMSFHFIGDRLFLEIDPCYLFTQDGIQPIKGVAQGKLSFQWSGRQSNPDVLRNTIFWIRVLTRGHPKLSIPTGNSPIILDGLPATSRMNAGISDDALGVGSLLRQAEKSLTAAADDIEIIFDENDELEGDDDE